MTLRPGPLEVVQEALWVDAATQVGDVDRASVEEQSPPAKFGFDFSRGRPHVLQLQLCGHNDRCCDGTRGGGMFEGLASVRNHGCLAEHRGEHERKVASAQF